ncbi:MAG: large subunit ribosomal protein L17 [Urechidicola sp.]|jgi:large subunit ribosomal protein L17|tara:strand:- start:5395 stop:6156 length:762 start_codon:yes stop_codon:yes gene_type:complete
MKHGKKFKSLSRTKSHRKALMGNLASELIKHKRIKTTLTKGKELRKYVEPVLTKCKTDTTHNRRLVFKALLNNEQAKHLVTEMFREIAPKIADRPGGYTRVIKLPPRQGDNAPMCYIELVDYNELLLAGGETKKPVTRRSRRGGSKSTTETTSDATATSDDTKSDNLTKIEGVGPKAAEAITAGGLTTFSAVAASTPEAIKAILDAAEGRLGSLDPTTWVDQAKLAAEGKWDELKKMQDEMDGGKPTKSKEEE